MNINEESVIEQFIDFEFKNRFFDIRIDDVPIWSISRFIVYNEILKRKMPIGEAHSSLKDSTMIKRLTLKFLQLPSMICKNPFINRKKKDILILNHNRKVKVEKNYSCIYTDNIIDNLKYSNIIIEEPFNEKHLKPFKHKNVFFSDYIHFMVSTKKIIRKKKLYDQDTKEIIIEILKKINSKFSLEFNYSDLGIKIHDTIISYKLMYPYYYKLLKIIEPRIIIEVVSYGLSRYVINDAASKLGIPTIELQHGTMGKFHEAYNFKLKMEISTFPDYMFVFGHFWKNETRLPIANDRTKVVGWPYYEKKVKEFEKHDVKDDRETILFVSQGTIGKELSKRAVEVSETINKYRYKIIYKLHPGEYTRWKNEYPWLLDADILVIDNNDHDMHYYFAQSDIQIGVYSTALFEGLGYGLKTIIVKLEGYETMMALYGNRRAYLVNSAEEILNICEDPKGYILDYDVSYFWSQNSMENIISEIDKIIKMRDE